MSQHLEECTYPMGTRMCICRELRACQDRSLQNALAAVTLINAGTTTHGDDWHERLGSDVKRDIVAALKSLAGES